MKNVWTIFRRETATYFNSPIAYIFILLFLLIQAFFFFIARGFFSQPVPNVSMYFEMIPWIFPVFIPAVTMRLWCEEKRAGTIELLMTMPLKSWQLVFGKYLSALLVVGLSLVLTIIVPITVSAVTELDWGTITAMYFGAFLLACVYTAVGSCISATTQNQIVALLVSIVFCYILHFIGTPLVVRWVNTSIGGNLGSFLGWFGATYHFGESIKGLISLLGVVYAVSSSLFFLTLNNILVESRKY